MAASNLTELLSRNLELLKDRRVLILGQLDDSGLIPLLKDCKSAVLIVDDYVSYQNMAALLGQKAGKEASQSCEYKQVRILFGAASRLLETLPKCDTLLMLLTKNKQSTRLLLSKAQPLLEEQGRILLAGANAGGGKSADSLLKEAGSPYKVDSARKCTLFALEPTAPFHALKEPACVSYEGLKLRQHPQVFSYGEVDGGTALLLEALKEQELFGHVLDLGCGCGIVGLSAASKTEVSALSFCDASAEALSLCAQNCRLNGLNKPYEIFASDMLSNAGTYEAICVNPPFHQGLDQNNQAALGMIAKALEHLSSQGSLYLVGNGFLHYETVLREHFPKVEVLRKTSKFTVCKAGSV
ncbi:MAG: methyltransferase [Succinivibrio sp.]|nr:methyltransferase [Succinivibrio sp.]